jgi:serine/threonine protein phosphatase PrpC
MEDAITLVGDFAGSGSSYFAIFDGHNGSDVSTYAAHNIHRLFNKYYSSDINICEQLFLTIEEVNKSLLTKWPDQGSTSALAIVIHNYIYTANTGDSRIVLIAPDGSVKQISEDHKVDSDKIKGVYALSRSLGDAVLTKDHSGEPHMTRTHRKDGMWMIIASAGVWSVMDNETAARIGNKKSTPTAAADAIKAEAVNRGTKDNVAVIVVFLTAK